MRRTLLCSPPTGMTDSLYSFIGDARVYDSSSSPEARVYYIEKDRGYYLKIGAPGSLATEAKMTEYFRGKGLGTEIISYESYEHDIMLSAAVAGEDCTHSMYLEHPERLADTIGELLRELHSLDFSDCPVKDRMTGYFALAEENCRTGNYDRSHFPDSFGYSSAEEAYRVMKAGRDLLKSDTLIHGDFCLPNIMLDGWRLSGYIDLGCAGVGDRHIDLFWGAWTLGFNLGTDKYRDRFLDAYGRDLVDEEKMRTVAAIEVFG